MAEITPNNDIGLGFEDAECVEISYERRVWGCPECGGKNFIVADGVSACIACVGSDSARGGHTASMATKVTSSASRLR